MYWAGLLQSEILFQIILGKFQGDDRKFLDRFTSYFGSQTAETRNKRWVFSYIFCLWLFRVGVTDCKWRTKPTKCCQVSGLVNKLRQLKITENVKIWELWVVSTIVLPKLALRNRSRCYWETGSNVKDATKRWLSRKHLDKASTLFTCNSLMWLVSLEYNRF